MGDDVTHAVHGGVGSGQRLEPSQRWPNPLSACDREQLGDVEVAIGHAHSVDSGRRRPMMGPVPSRSVGDAIVGRRPARERDPTGNDRRGQTDRENHDP